jgi:deoxyribonuclease-2
MGNCCYKQNVESSLIVVSSTKTYFALKFPHGINGIEYSNSNQKFISCNINIWLKQFYTIDKKWTNWIVYNDELPKLNGEDNFITKKGHCKGIITWNENKISWLCHSVPKFPDFNFDSNSINDINKSELVYGQSFQIIEFEFKPEIIASILLQLHIMEANIYIHNYDRNLDNLIQYMHHIPIRNITISNSIIHIAKSPKYEIDIYSDYISVYYKYNWQIETWIRGHKITNLSNNCSDIIDIEFENINWKESQDHSKWAVSNSSYYFIGDLNRMTSQFKRGGGGFICNDKNISNALRLLIKN